MAYKTTITQHLDVLREIRSSEGNKVHPYYVGITSYQSHLEEMYTSSIGCRTIVQIACRGRRPKPNIDVARVKYTTNPEDGMNGRWAPCEAGGRKVLSFDSEGNPEAALCDMDVYRIEEGCNTCKFHVRAIWAAVEVKSPWSTKIKLMWNEKATLCLQTKDPVPFQSGQSFACLKFTGPDDCPLLKDLAVILGRHHCVTKVSKDRHTLRLGSISRRRKGGVSGSGLRSRRPCDLQHFFRQLRGGMESKRVVVEIEEKFRVDKSACVMLLSLDERKNGEESMMEEDGQKSGGSSEESSVSSEASGNSPNAMGTGPNNPVAQADQDDTFDSRTIFSVLNDDLEWKRGIDAVFTDIMCDNGADLLGDPQGCLFDDPTSIFRN